MKSVTPIPRFYCFVLIAAFFTNSPVAGNDLSEAKQIAKTNCLVCHGETGISLNSEWPNLAGQKYGYLLTELRKFRDKRRTDVLMSPSVQSLNENQLKALAKYYSQQKPANDGRKRAEGEKINRAAENLAINLCSRCHGYNGISVRDEWPNLAGQNSDYIYKSLHGYKERVRSTELMNDIPDMIYDNEFRLLADYFSDLPDCIDSEDADVPCNLQSEGSGDYITEIGNGIYTYTYLNHLPTIYVTPEGVIVVDPPTRQAAQHIKDEIKERFNLPVRYVLLSHAHPDHNSGAEIFTDTARIVSSIETKKEMEKINHHEIEAAKRENRLVQYLNPIPDIVFSDRMTLALGGKTVELEVLDQNGFSHTMHGGAKAGSLMLIDFVEPQFLVAADSVIPFGLGYMDFRYGPVIQNLKDAIMLEQRNFKHFSLGHGRPSTKEGITSYREYLEFLIEAVEDAINDGLSMEETVARIQVPDKFAKTVEAWGQLSFEFNIEGAYKQLKLYKEEGKIPKAM